MFVQRRVNRSHVQDDTHQHRKYDNTCLRRFFFKYALIQVKSATHRSTTLQAQLWSTNSHNFANTGNSRWNPYSFYANNQTILPFLLQMLDAFKRNINQFCIYTVLRLHKGVCTNTSLSKYVYLFKDSMDNFQEQPQTVSIHTSS